MKTECKLLSKNQCSRTKEKMQILDFRHIFVHPWYCSVSPILDVQTLPLWFYTVWMMPTSWVTRLLHLFSWMCATLSRHRCNMWPMRVSCSWNWPPSLSCQQLEGSSQSVTCFLAYGGCSTALKTDDMKNIEAVGLNIEFYWFFPDQMFPMWSSGNCFFSILFEWAFVQLCSCKWSLFPKKRGVFMFKA